MTSHAFLRVLILQNLDTDYCAFHSSSTNLIASSACPGCNYLHMNQTYQIRTSRKPPNFRFKYCTENSFKLLTHLHFSMARKICSMNLTERIMSLTQFSWVCWKKNKDHCIIWTTGSSFGWYMLVLLLHNCWVIRNFIIMDWINNSADVCQEGRLT